MEWDGMVGWDGMGMEQARVACGKVDDAVVPRLSEIPTD